MKRIYIIILCMVFLISFVAGNPVKDFWESKGLSPGEAQSISEGNANSSTTLKAQELQTPTELINETEAFLEQERITRNFQGFSFMSFLGIMGFVNIMLLARGFFSGGRV